MFEDYQLDAGKKRYIREQKIIEAATDLRGRCQAPSQSVDKLEVDAAFVFRLDPLWYRCSATIRRMMRRLLDRPGHGPLSEKDQIIWAWHLMQNRWPQASLGGQEASTHEGYVGLEMGLPRAQEYEQADQTQRRLAGGPDTDRVRSWLYCLATAYNVIPDSFDPDDWGPNRIARQYQQLAVCVMSDRGSRRLFRWERVRLVEQRRGQRRLPAVRPERWATWVIHSEGAVTHDEGLAPGWTFAPEAWDVGAMTRIRTFTVYYLSKRGGGRLTEEQAVGVWNVEFKDVLRERTFRGERDRLLDVTLTKRMKKSG
jgi:hypothetical protein